MTDAPKPTQEEQDRALWYARMLAPTPADNENHNLARCHIHATAELARAEERIRDLGGYLAAALANHMAPNVVKLVAERGMKLARGEEETTMKCTAAKCELPDCPEHTTKFTPKPGERAVLVSSPNYPNGSERIGRTFVRLPIERDASLPPYWDSEEEEVVRISRDAVFAPAQAEQPPAVASGVAAGEVTDEAAVMACMSWMEAYGKDNDGKLPHIAEAFYAGRASVLAERSEMERRVEDLAKRVMPGAETLAASLEASQAEVAELKRAVEYWTDQAESQRTAKERDTLRQELEAAKAAHAETRARLSQAESQLLIAERRVEEQGEVLMKARAVPSREQIADAVQGAITARDQNSGEGWFAKYLRAADAVLALFASPPASPDNTPPRQFCDYEDCDQEPLPDGVFCEDHEEPDNTPPEPLPECRCPRALVAKGGHYRGCPSIEAHWRSQQSHELLPRDPKAGES